MFRTITLCAFLAACGGGKNDGPSCKEVGASFLALGQRQLDAAKASGSGGTVDETLASVETHLPAMRDSMVLSCTDGKWSAESRSCFAAATDDATMISCYETLGPEQRALLDEGRDPKPRK